MIKTMDKRELRKILSQIRIYKRGTPEGEAQREAFRIRWGKLPKEI